MNRIKWFSFLVSGGAHLGVLLLPLTSGVLLSEVSVRPGQARQKPSPLYTVRIVEASRRPINSNQNISTLLKAASQSQENSTPHSIPVLDVRAHKPEQVFHEKQLSAATATSPDERTDPLLPQQDYLAQPANTDALVPEAGVDLPTQPTPVYQLAPEYPLSARRREMEGVAAVRLDISADGRVLHAQVTASSGYALLDESVLQAVRQWRFQEGEIGRSYQCQFRFELEDF